MNLAMQATSTCPRCGSVISADAPRGLCPRCLVSASLSVAKPKKPSADLAAATRPSLRVIGDYEILEELGQGGMGVVFKARQRGLNRIVALKMLLLGRWTNPRFVERFRSEARAAAALRHPGIVAIYEVGEHEGQPWFTMDYVPGPSLADLVREHPLPPRRAAALIRSVAEAIQHAHAHGIIHRDLKPANIILDADDSPRITDFGLAKEIRAASDLTLSGQILGSPHYMPPEQLSGRQKANATCDVYALGAILYHLLTGRPPFQADSLEATLLQVLEREPAPLSLLNPDVPADLETVCLKCLEKEPAKRYASAHELADELDRFLRDEPIHARPVSRAERAWRWCRRKPALAGSFLLILILLLILLIGSPIAALRINSARQRAEANAIEARRAQYASDMNLAHQAVQDGDFFRARQLLERHRPAGSAGVPPAGVGVAPEPSIREPLDQVSGATPETARGTRALPADRLKAELQTPPSPISHLRSAPPPADLRGWEWRYLHEQARGEEEFTLGHHTNGVSALGILSDGHTVWSAGWDNAVRLWDLRSRRELALLPHPHQIYHAAASPDGRWLVTAAWLRNDLGPLRVWELSTRREVATLAANFWLGPNVAFSPDGRLFAFQTLIPHDGFHVWDFESRRELAFLESNPRNNIAPVGLAFSPDSRTLAYAAGHNGDVLLWDVATRTRTHRLSGHERHVMGLAFSPDGVTLASGDIGGVLKLWDVAARRERGGFTNQGAVVRFAFSPDGTLLAAGGWF